MKSTVTNDRQHGARHGLYGTHEHYVQPYLVIKPLNWGLWLHLGKIIFVGTRDDPGPNN